ncbi:unnamed protein product [Effrenium voratum]|nr:unnamed protein product [Effrenium voratum]
MARIPDVNHMHSVKIDNITCNQDEVIGVKEELREKFSKFGEIGDVYIPRDRNFAFVRFFEKRRGPRKASTRCSPAARDGSPRRVFPKGD